VQEDESTHDCRIARDPESNAREEQDTLVEAERSQAEAAEQEPDHADERCHAQEIGDEIVGSGDAAPMQGREAGESLEDIEDIDQAVEDESEENPGMQQAHPRTRSEDRPLQQDVETDRDDAPHEERPAWPTLSASDGPHEARDTVRDEQERDESQEKERDPFRCTEHGINPPVAPAAPRRPRRGRRLLRSRRR